MVLPITARTNRAGHLEIGGRDTVELASEYGTPLFIYDEADVRSQCRAYQQAFASPDVKTRVVYASKAFCSTAICQLVREEGLSVDVSSGGELYVALGAGFTPADIYMHGNNKTPAELEMAVAAGVGVIVIDSFDEIDRLTGLLPRGDKQLVMLRITPGVRPDTHEYIQTGQADSKFGFGLHEDSAFAAIARVQSEPALELVGYHAHIGSQISAAGSYVQAIEVITGFAADVYLQTGFSPKVINFGGGLGIRYMTGDPNLAIEEYCRAVIDTALARRAELGLEFEEIIIEPGRSIVGRAGVTLYTVGTVKHIPGVRTYVSVDGGMSDNLRPMLYQARYEGLLANKMGADPAGEVTVAGKHCESGDIIISDVALPEVVVGDILCTPATGAYGYAMANNYNKQPRPAVVMVAEGSSHVIVKRETFPDMVRLDVPLERKV